MAKVNFYTETETIDGVKYVAQFNGARTAAKFTDQTTRDDGKGQSIEKTADFVFENVIVEPKVTLDDFEDMEVAGKVVAFGVEVMMGTYRKKKNISTNKETSK